MVNSRLKMRGGIALEIVSNKYFQSMVNNMKLDVFFHGYVYADEQWNLEPYLEPCHRLYYVTKGQGVLYTDQEEVKLKEGHVYVFPRRIPYGLRCDGTMEKFFVHFTMNIIPGLDAFDCFTHHLEMPFYSEELGDIFKLVQSEKLGDILRCKSVIYSTLAEIISPYSQTIVDNTKKKMKYQELYKYVESNCYFGITVSELAGIMGVSQSYLSRSFKKDMGITLKQYIDQQVTNKIKQMLMFTDKSIKDIALELNFCDEFYCSNFFKRQTKRSPSAYRAINRASC